MDVLCQEFCIEDANGIDANCGTRIYDGGGELILRPVHIGIATGEGFQVGAIPQRQVQLAVVVFLAGQLLRFIRTCPVLTDGEDLLGDGGGIPDGIVIIKRTIQALRDKLCGFSLHLDRSGQKTFLLFEVFDEVVDHFYHRPGVEMKFGASTEISFRRFL